MYHYILVSIFISSCILGPGNPEIIQGHGNKSDSFYKCYYYKDYINESDTIEFKKVVQKVLLIPEVVKYSAEIKVKDSMNICVTNLEIDTQYIYKVIIGQELYTHYSTRFRFYITRKDNKIFVLDLARDSIVSLDQWRIDATK
jgi:hypothetical protein